jgi:hypothetical protein
VGVRLADDLLRSSSKLKHPGRIRQTPSSGFAAGSRQIVGKPASHAFGRIKRRAVILSSRAAFDFALLADMFHLPRRTSGAKTSNV